MSGLSPKAGISCRAGGMSAKANSGHDNVPRYLTENKFDDCAGAGINDW
jgi:hypothetical protein